MALDIGVFLDSVKNLFKAKVSSNDTQPDYLINKFTSSDASVTITETNDGGVEQINLQSSGGGGAGNTIYTADDSLTGNRIVTYASNTLTFDGGKTTFKGAGSTSATTALLVENSSGTDLLEIKDDGQGLRNASAQLITQFNSTAIHPYIEVNSTAGNHSSVVFSQASTQKYLFGFETTTGGFRLRDLTAGANRLVVTSAGKVNLFEPSTTTEDFNVKGTGLFEVNDNNPLTIRNSGNANMFLAIDSASTSWNSQVQFQQGTAAKWNIGCKGTTQSFWFYNHGTTNTPLEIDSSDNIIMANLPTSSAGLPTGALWNNSGVINIV
jgi:hypothetical protein